MMNISDLDVYKLAEELSDMLWHAFDKRPEKFQRTIGYQVIRSADSIAANPKVTVVTLLPIGVTFIVMHEALLKKQRHGYANLSVVDY